MTEDDLVIGYVQGFGFKQSFDGFGFVVPLLTGPHPTLTADATVFIHTRACREFGGTAEQPQITNERPSKHRIERRINSAEGHIEEGNHPSLVIMRLKFTDRGPRAAAWAIFPRRPTAANILLSENIGREMILLPANAKPSSGMRGVLRSCLLTDTGLSVTLTSPRWMDGAPMVAEEVSKTIDLANCYVIQDSPRFIVLLLGAASGPVVQQR